MLTFEEALAKARARIEDLTRELPGRELVVLEELVRERTRGWAFSYDTKKFLETCYPLDGLVGNGPIFVDKENGNVYDLPSGGYVAWLDAYDRTGTPPPAQGMRWVGSGPATPFPEPHAKKPESR